MNLNEIQQTETSLSSHFQLRPVQWSGLEAVTQLIYDVCAADGDTTVAVTSEELKHEWQNPGFELERDAILVETNDGRVVGMKTIGLGMHAASGFVTYEKELRPGCNVGEQ